MDQLSYLYVTTGKTIDLTIWIFVSKVISWLFNMLATFVIAFLPRSKLQSPSRVILEPKKMKSVTASIFFRFYLPWSDGTRCHDVRFLMLSSKPAFSLSSFTLEKLFDFSSFSAIIIIILHSWRTVKVKVAQSCPNLCDPHGLYSPWNSPGQNTGVGSLFLLQGNLPNPEIKPRSPTLQVDFLPNELQEIANYKRIPSTWLPSSLFKERKYWNSIHY